MGRLFEANDLYFFRFVRNSFTMFRVSYLAVAALSILLISCDKENFEPIACLDVDNIYPAVGELVTFTDCSEEAYRIEIDFGDGTLSRSEIIEHSYAEEGEYAVELKAWNKNGKKKNTENGESNRLNSESRKNY